MSGYKFKYAEGTSELMLKIMKECKDTGTYKRAQIVYLRSAYGYGAEHIAQITGLSLSRVNTIHSLYKNHGEEIIYEKARGGRRHSNMTEEEEKAFLKEHQEKSSKGEITTIVSIHSALEEKLGKKVHRSGVYKMLKRNGWRKIMPRPQHPDHNEDEITSFKKKCQN
jgi:transposase